MTIPRLQLAHITKRYPAVVANSDVSLTVQPGETHAVLGENGAGKSTLMKIIYGSVKPDEGSVMWNGQPVHIRNPQEARALGISMVFQHFSLFDTLTVAENVWLGLDKRLTLNQVTHSITAKAAEYGLDIDPSRPVHTLSVGEMQRVEIIRSLLTNPKLLILDEPTSVLTPQAVEKLFVVLKKLASEGCSILYISHKLHEIRELCNACTVLRGGKVTGVCNPQQESNASLSRLMIGAEPPALEHHERTPGESVLRVAGLSLAREDQFGVDLDGIALEVRAGEVVGIAGVSGNGQRELLYALSGEDTRAQPSMIQVFGKDVGHFGPAHRRGAVTDATGLGVAFGIDALSFLASAWTLAQVRLHSQVQANPAAPAPANQPVFAAVAAGLRHLWNDRDMRLCFIYWGVVAVLITGPVQIAVPVLATTLNLGAAALGILLGAHGAGTLIGMAMSGAKPGMRLGTLGMTMLVVDGVVGVLFMPMGLITATWQGAMLLGTIGVLGGFMQVSIFTWLQRRTPPALMGRVMSMFMFIFLGLAPLSGAVTGWMLRSITLTQLFVGSGGLLVCIALLALVASPVRQVTDGPQPPWPHPRGS